MLKMDKEKSNGILLIIYVKKLAMQAKKVNNSWNKRFNFYIKKRIKRLKKSILIIKQHKLVIYKIFNNL